MLGLGACRDVVERQTQQQGRVCDDTTNTANTAISVAAEVCWGLVRESFLLNVDNIKRRLYMADTTKLALALLDPPHMLSDRPRGDAVKLLVRDPLQVLLP